MSNFVEKKPNELSDNVFNLIAKDWTLITAGNKDSYNMMTASWAGLGFLWNKNVCFLFIRPSRYTLEFVEREETLSLNFFDESFRDVLTLCGRKSGREINKMKDVPLTPFSLSDGGVAFNESRMVMNCRKLSVADMKDFEFIDDSVLSNYSSGDFHKVYICEIKEVLIKE